jgi:hypothetical protein
MNKILNNNLKNYVLSLANEAQTESKVFPVDRIFLKRHLKEIESLDYTSFLYYNLELTADTYVNQLFICLPEIWINVSLDDLIEISKLFTNVHSYFTLIKFTYKYIEIDIIQIVLYIAKEKKISYLNQILEYLENQWNTIVKSEGEMEDFEDGFIDVDYAEWKYIKQKFLIDNRIKPAFLNFNEVKHYVKLLIEKNK